MRIHYTNAEYFLCVRFVWNRTLGIKDIGIYHRLSIVCMCVCLFSLRQNIS